ncbi:phage shock protein PspA [Candidatus Sumerlaeota bacterium]|nr:phage shock protein PspA [Candidatus Sumerlaeota bacterium]
MGIFSRFRDIIHSNLNSMLEKAEDPEKLIRMMIQEMEDTLIEIKANCAGSIATKTKIRRQKEECEKRIALWDERAQLAVGKGRDDLAREALAEKKGFREKLASLDQEEIQCESLIQQYQDDIVQLEEKLAAAREKQRILLERHKRAQSKIMAQSEIRRMDTTDAFVRFEKFENRIERMEAEADLVNFGRKPSLDDKFSELEKDEDIERELDELKGKKQKS